MHATTGLLATKRVHVPTEFTDQAITRMTAYFRTGPLLAAAPPITFLVAPQWGARPPELA
ncbi:MULTISPECIES: hypothetical protein [Streptomycetaceae]|uniref:Uncharacterized protein n=1 Tax=Streptantibioticus cattleyicolor (strain ATCC 35852 / DSM 46488 / JCM 4925 / NBRC 14057 / NRRL 8057) TaxID=1003195 RepID=F8JS55_STREN|nr:MULTISPECIES: hypothetical protein [Streptomycetaceae]AEW94163.1 hypothetical protein SCATT_17920 [Streptantibioticus cattleyicolor NRRL 8057 = DSM 46488]MYS58828.1 hypothetical protein [Streptomyces sp. SID5468]CCB74519.1 protein of unknown function [Streptantibioticus cattleyicolor NRRL 8057 = DSM 46488]